MGAVGGTSVATPLLAGMAAVADQGRTLAGGGTLGSTAMLTDLYNLQNIAPGDFHDITTGGGGYLAGPGYDLVTGIGTPVANKLLLDLSAYGLASESNIVTQPPPAVVQNDPFGIVAQATDSIGIPDPTYTGDATLTLLERAGRRHVHASHRPERDGLAIFDGLTLSQLSGGTDYVFQVSFAGLDAIDDRPRRRGGADPGVANYYPLPFDYGNYGYARDAVLPPTSTAPTSVITLSISSLPYAINNGELPLFNGAGGSKTIDIIGQGDRTRSSAPAGRAGTSRSSATPLHGELPELQHRGRVGDRRRLPKTFPSRPAVAC